jgi:hypothetical protein
MGDKLILVRTHVFVFFGHTRRRYRRWLSTVLMRARALPLS